MMSQATFFSRIGEWFRIRGSNGEIPISRELDPMEADTATREEENHAMVPVRERLAGVGGRLGFLRPWGRRDAALASLQRGFDGLTELMTAIRDSLDEQGRRQEAMLSELTRLPDALKSLPEAQRVQAEALAAIGQQLEQQIHHQDQLAAILDKVSGATEGQHSLLSELHGRVDGINSRHDALAESLREVGAAMATAGQATESSSTVLRQLHEDIATRKDDMERVFQQQNTRVTVMLGAAMVLSAAALATVIIVGLMLLRKPAVSPAPVPAAPAPAMVAAVAEAPAAPAAPVGEAPAAATAAAPAN